jgi:hypothetical protein
MDSEQFEPLDIDDRSPGERLVASGRVGLSRLGELGAEQRLDFVALLWMVCIVAYTGVQIYQVVHLFDQGIPVLDAWEKIAALGQTAAPITAVSCLVGIALALMSDTAVSRFAFLLAGIVGMWVLIAGAFDVATAVHHGDDEIFGGQFAQGNRAVGVIGGLALAGFGLVVAMVAWRAGGTRPIEPPEIS